MNTAATMRGWLVVTAASMAGGLGWGIRGQFGHETGAMMAGLLVNAVLVLLLAPAWPSLAAARAVAWGTVAMGMGGSMTYGQTVGLTQNPAMIGHHTALAWGLLGLAIKGGLWIGFAGLFLGMGLGGRRYPWWEIAALMLAMLGLAELGTWWLNSPFDPVNHVLPRIYFSADWRWEPAAVLKPRREVWGGYLVALLGAAVWIGAVRRDRLALRLLGWGVLGGAIGFPAGQSLAAFHAWHPEIFRSGSWASVDPVINWWNFMETTFGAIMGAALGVGLWRNRRLIAVPAAHPASSWPAWVGLILLGVHLTLLMLEEFGGVVWVSRLYDPGMVLAFVPLVAGRRIGCGRMRFCCP